MIRVRSFGMSFLDVLCSAMGGMVVLAVIFAIVQKPVPIPITDSIIIIELKTDSLNSIGIIVTNPDKEKTVLEATTSKEVICNTINGASSMKIWQGKTSEESSHKTYVEVSGVIPGTWQFEPFFVDWDVNSRDGIDKIGFHVWTKDGKLEPIEEVKPEQLENPGEISRKIKVVIERDPIS